ncbi:MAG: aldo/keto reductase [Spirochaetota bacterium]
MIYRNLGRTSVRVSSLCLGTMAFGRQADEPVAHAIMDRAVEGGITFFDTANVYNDGESERIVGRWLAQSRRRDEIFLATKFGNERANPVHGQGLSRRHVIAECDASLLRLQTDRIDLYQVHRMWPGTQIDELFRALDDLVRAGKILYIGTSKWAPPLIAEVVALCDRYGWTKPVTEQPPYNLLDRRVEDELLWTCNRYGIGVIPWAPIAAGVLSGKYGEGSFDDRSRFGDWNHRCTPEAVDAVELLRPLAEEKGVTLAELALAWVMNQPAVTAPIVGPRTVDQLVSSLKAVDIELTRDDYERIDSIFPPGSHLSDYWEGNVYSMLRRQLGIER